MSSNDSAFVRSGTPLSPRSGVWFGFLGVLAFSFTVPFTRVAVGALDPLFVGTARAVVAGVLAMIALAVCRVRFPSRSQVGRLVVVAIGIVAGFPVLTSLALTTTTAAHSAVIIGLLPAITAATVVMRTGERPGRRFWMFSIAGACAVVGYSLVAHGSLGSPTVGDLYLVGAVVLGALGYSEGGLLARELGAWQTVSWALVVAFPVMATATVVVAVISPPHASPAQWSAFAYLGVVSMFFGFFAWYRGLAVGPMTTVSQTQLIQPVLTLIWSALLIGEAITAPLIIGGVVIVGCAWGAVRSRMATATTGSVATPVVTGSASPEARRGTPVPLR
ncbi:DMT family transporter [Williamsia maris]|uniref:Permease of the drug/metabolite transporter (DMT) superfamily n=1 Tax=Williamsia maris TaxID=72806 RepID=A0ABT1H8H7_9NOCA|nr:DMT family transporter [Williamsia maris]MCP2174562.1 Permease of the drug/metabolite transporter (DMT) superfamily [Williamsia maris]